MKEINSTTSNYDGRNKKIVNKKLNNSNKFENDYDSKRKIQINEGKKTLSSKNININFSIVQ